MATTSRPPEISVKVRMPDGMHLATDIYLPLGINRFPSVVIRTPYNRKAHAAEAPHWTSRGYCFIAQDVRGRFDSEGDWYPYEHEHADGVTTLDWITNQSWSNGAVALKGASYQAFAAFAAAETHHPSLRTIITYVPAMGLYETTFTPDQILYLAGRFWWEVTHGSGPLTHADALRSKLQETPNLFMNLPVSQLDQLAGLEVAHWHRHTEAVLTDEDLRKRTSIRPDMINIPVLHVGGWNDPFASLTISNFIQTGKSLGAKRPTQRLIIGPWGHEVNSATHYGQRRFGPDSVIDLASVEVSWLDCFLYGKENSIETLPPVQYFVMGSNQWRTCENWPPTSETLVYYLSSNGEANKSDGCLSTTPPQDESPDLYVYDPAFPTPSRPYPMDQRDIEKRSDVLVYTTPKLSQDITIVGASQVHLYLSTDAPDLDIIARLIDVFPSGEAIFVAQGQCRARRQKGSSTSQDLVSDQIYAFDITLAPVALTFRHGHQLRLDIASSSFPYLERNPASTLNSKGEIQMRTSKQALHHNEKFRSTLILPTDPHTPHGPAIAKS